MIERLIETLDPDVDVDVELCPTEPMEYPPKDQAQDDGVQTESAALALTRRPPIARDRGTNVLESPTENHHQRSRPTDTIRPKTPSKPVAARAETKTTRPPPPPPISRVPPREAMEGGSLNFESDFDLVDQSLVDTEKIEDKDLDLPPRRRS